MTEATDQFAELHGKIAAMRKEIERAFVGQTSVVDEIVIALLSGGHVLLEGVPGLGKTMLVKTLSQVLDLKSSRIQFTPDLMPADIIGTDILEEDEQGKRNFRFQQGPIFANLVLADEINRATLGQSHLAWSTLLPDDRANAHPCNASSQKRH